MSALWIAWAGLAASALTAAFFAVLRPYQVTRFSPATHLGCLFVDDPRLPMAETLGLLVHLAVGSTLIPAAYALALPWLGGPGWGTGALLGFVHGGAAVASLALFSRVNRAVRAGRLPPPGRFGQGWGRFTPLVIVTAGVLYGAVAGAVLRAASQDPGANLADAPHVLPHHVARPGQRPLQGVDGTLIQMFSLSGPTGASAMTSENY